jgi:hypothetical protein
MVDDSIFMTDQETHCDSNLEGDADLFLAWLLNPLDIMRART